MSTVELRRKIKRVIDRLPPQRLASVADYVAFLDRPPIASRIATAEKGLAAGKGIDWRKVRKDVEVILSPEAAAFYGTADPPLARKFARCFAQLERDPRRHTTLTGSPAGCQAAALSCR